MPGLRVFFVFVAVAVVSTAARPSLAEVHCRREGCRPEERDPHGCCPAPPPPPPRRTPRRCPEGEHRSAGHCCPTGEEWVPQRGRCMCLDADVCGPGARTPGGRGGAPPPPPPPPSAAPSSCEGGDAAACTDAGAALAMMGDDVGAARLYRRGCEGGDGVGCRALALAYHDGNGVPTDDSEAVRYSRRACTLGVAGGCTDLGILTLRGHGTGTAPDAVTAARLFRQGCDAGDAAGCQLLGVQYFRGEGVPLDLDEAFRYARLACDGGDAMGCVDVGFNYRRGTGVTEDVAAAVRHFQMGCDDGAPSGCSQLCYHYFAGMGLPADDYQAARHCRMGCDGGSGAGCTGLGFLYAVRRGVDTTDQLSADVEAARLFDRACSLGSPDGCADRAYFYMVGRGGRRDMAEATRLFSRACSAGIRAACSPATYEGPLGMVVELGPSESRPPPSETRPVIPQRTDAGTVQPAGPCDYSCQRFVRGLHHTTSIELGPYMMGLMGNGHEPSGVFLRASYMYTFNIGHVWPWFHPEIGIGAGSWMAIETTPHDEDGPDLDGDGEPDYVVEQGWREPSVIWGILELSVVLRLRFGERLSYFVEVWYPVSLGFGWTGVDFFCGYMSWKLRTGAVLGNGMMLAVYLEELQLDARHDVRLWTIGATVAF